MKTRQGVRVTWVSAATVMACVALLSAPAVSNAADPKGSSAEAGEQATAVLARGAGYGQQHGEARVRSLQRRLRALGQRPGPVDGLFGLRTEEAVKRLQRDSGLAFDGIVGPQTRRVLNGGAALLSPGAGYGRPAERRQVRELQRQLRALGHGPGRIDGLYGPRTRAAVERFQRAAGDPVTGIVSRGTEVALVRADSGDRIRRAGEPRRPTEPRRGSEPRTGSERRTGSETRSGGQTPAGSEPRRPTRRPAIAQPDQSRQQTPTAAEDQTAESGGADSTSPVLLALVALVVAAIGLALAGWLRGRRRRPEPAPVPAPSRPGPDRGGDAALGYVSLRAPGADEHELEEQMAAISTGCRQHGLDLKVVIRDLEQADDTGPDRPGMRDALRRLEVGEESCLVVAELGRLSHSAPEIGEIVESVRRREARLVAVGEGVDTATWNGADAADVLGSLTPSNAEAPRRSDVEPSRPAHAEPPRPANAEPPRPANGERPRQANGGPPRQANGESPRWAEESRRMPAPRPRPPEWRNGGRRPRQDDPVLLKERIRAMRESGMTLQAIADQLNAENVPTLRGGAEWRPSAVQGATGYQRPRSKGSPRSNRPGSSGRRAGNYRAARGRGNGGSR